MGKGLTWQATLLEGRREQLGQREMKREAKDVVRAVWGHL